jgi:hypothetical protein
MAVTELVEHENRGVGRAAGSAVSRSTSTSSLGRRRIAGIANSARMTDGMPFTSLTYTAEFRSKSSGPAFATAAFTRSPAFMSRLKTIARTDSSIVRASPC